MQNYYVASLGEVYGPYPESDLVRLWTEKRVAPDAMVCIEGTEAWEMLNEHPVVVAVLASQAIPAAVEQVQASASASAAVAARTTAVVKRPQQQSQSKAPVRVNQQPQPQPRSRGPVYQPPGGATQNAAQQFMAMQETQRVMATQSLRSAVFWTSIISLIIAAIPGIGLIMWLVGGLSCVAVVVLSILLITKGATARGILGIVWGALFFPLALFFVPALSLWVLSLFIERPM